RHVPTGRVKIEIDEMNSGRRKRVVRGLSIFKSCGAPSSAVAFLVLLARAAGTGLIAANFRLVPNNCFDLARFFARGGALVWAGEVERRWAARRTTPNRFVRFSGNDLQIEERSNRIRI